MAHLLLLLKLVGQHHLFFGSLLLLVEGLLHWLVCSGLTLLLLVVEVVETVGDALFIHGDTLLENVQGT